MLLHLILILGSVGLIGAMFTGWLLLAVIGIQRGDHGKRLTGTPDGRTEVLARRMLVRSLGHGPTAHGEDGQS